MKKLTPKSTVAEALQNPRAVALAEKIHPGITTHPLLWMFRRCRLEEATKHPRLGINQAKLTELLNYVNED